MTSLQQHTDTLDALKKQVAAYGESDLANILLSSDLLEVALENNPEQTKEYIRQLFGGMVQDNEVIFADAANSAEQFADTVVKKMNG